MNIFLALMSGVLLLFALLTISLHLKINRTRKALRQSYGYSRTRKSKKRRDDHDVFWMGGGVSDTGTVRHGADGGSSCGSGSDGGGSSSCGGGCGGGGGD
ncbi:hypothetical protein [Paenibacillus xanthanilyticus]|uniref:Uncharacterized protein n=1 Tax=Paenibacillus xanthanilyticus TaxID=1783531 RepID=A0ABV8K5B5_9BACL